MNVRIVHQHTGAVKVGRLGTDDRSSPFHGSQPTVTLHFGNLIGAREFSFQSGYGKAIATSKEAPIRDWRIHHEDLEVIRDMARKEGKVVKPCGKSTGRPRKPKRGPNPHPRQLNLIGSDR